MNESNRNNFLHNLKKAVETGDAAMGADSINKINEIHKLASTIDGRVARSKIEERIKTVGEKTMIKPNERRILSVEAERERLRIEMEEEKLKAIAKIKNNESEMISLKHELEEIQKQYLKIIEKLDAETNILKIKFEAKYNEIYDEKYQ